MKIYILVKDFNNKSCLLKNMSSLKLDQSFYNWEILKSIEPIEITFNGETENRYLPLKNIIVFWGLSDTFIVDEYAMNILSKNYHQYLKFIKVTVSEDSPYKDKNFYLLYFVKIVHGVDEEKSNIKFNTNDKFVLNEEANKFPIFKCDPYTTLTFVNEDFKKYVEDNNIVGWKFKEVYEF